MPTSRRTHEADDKDEVNEQQQSGTSMKTIGNTGMDNNPAGRVGDRQKTRDEMLQSSVRAALALAKSGTARVVQRLFRLAARRAASISSRCAISSIRAHTSRSIG